MRIGYRILARPRGSDSTTSNGTGEGIRGRTMQFSSQPKLALIPARWTGMRFEVLARLCVKASIGSIVVSQMRHC